MLQVVSEELLGRLLDYRSLVQRLRDAFRSAVQVPARQHYRLGESGEDTLLIMPAWREGGAAGVKIVTVIAANPARGLPLVSGSYLLLDGPTGRPLAVLDGAALTLRRTAAASALASTFLSRPDCRTMLMVGAGALAPELVRAHATVRSLQRIRIWNRHPEKADRLAARLSSEGLPVEAADDLEAAARAADLVSCATPSTDPLIRGGWLRAGTHLDLVGSFTRRMREADLEAVMRARVFVDTREGALAEAGELLHALAESEFRERDVQGDLRQLCLGEVSGRGGESEITLFKSVGTALEDLAAAELAYQRLTAPESGSDGRVGS